MLTVVNKNAEGFEAIKRSNPTNGKVYEYLVKAPSDNVQGFLVTNRFETKREADDYLKLNAESRRIWHSA